jgi:hypothetical protein
MFVIDGRFQGKKVKPVGDNLFKIIGEDCFIETEIRKLEACDDILDLSADIWEDDAPAVFYQIVSVMTSRDLIDRARRLLDIVTV